MASADSKPAAEATSVAPAADSKPAEVKAAGAQRAAVKAGKDPAAAGMIKALEAEARGYQVRGLEDREADVRKQIAFWQKRA